MENKSARAGRKDATERIRELVSLLGSLSKTGDSVTLKAISTRMGLSLEDAKSMMDIVCAASGEESFGLLISSNDDGTEFTLQYPGVHGRPLRLTEAETVAVIHALDLVGIDDGDPLRDHLREAFTSPDVVDLEVRQALGRLDGVSSDKDSKTLGLCAQARVGERELVFLYRGVKDVEPRLRRVMVLRISNDEARWHLHAFDMDIQEERMFRLDRMSDVSLGELLPENADELVASRNAEKEDTERLVGITFYDPSYVTTFEWPGLRVLQRGDYVLQGVIPYYGRGSTWLLRRIVACGGTLVVDDNEIMAEARAYARELLEGCTSD